MTKYPIQWQDQFGRWQHFQTKTNEADTFRTMKRRATTTGKRHRMTDDAGRMLDVDDP